MFNWRKKGRCGFSGYIFPSLIVGSDIDLNNRCISGLGDFRVRFFLYLLGWLCLTGKKKVVSLDTYFLLLIVGSDIDLKCRCIEVHGTAQIIVGFRTFYEVIYV